MFSRRHYRIIALILADLTTSNRAVCPRALVAAFARAFCADNPRFNRAAFYRACGMEDRPNV